MKVDYTTVFSSLSISDSYRHVQSKVRISEKALKKQGCQKNFTAAT